MAKKKAKKPARRKGGAKRPAAKKAGKSKAKKKAPKKKAARKPAPKPVKFTSINPYLTFNGNCEEAFNFYKGIFGGKFTYIGRYKDMPTGDGPPVPAEQANYIMHISLPISKETTLMGADASEGFGGRVNFGTNITISVNAKSKTEADRIFNGLSAGGTVTMPMSNTFWGSYFGMCVDRFGILWMMSYAEHNM